MEIETKAIMVRIVQLLCPERHCLVAAPYEDDRMTFRECCDALKTAFDTGGFNSHCGICGSRDLHFEDGAKEFSNLKEAAPSLQAMMEQNMHTRTLLDALGLTYDKSRSN